MTDSFQRRRKLGRGKAVTAKERKGSSDHHSQLFACLPSLCRELCTSLAGILERKIQQRKMLRGMKERCWDNSLAFFFFPACMTEKAAPVSEAPLPLFHPKRHTPLLTLLGISFIPCDQPSHSLSLTLQRQTPICSGMSLYLRKHASQTCVHD